jgi:hypothetical protein
MTTTISGSNGIVFPDATSMQTGQQAVKAWVNFNGQGTVAIRASYGVSSISDNGTGNYTVNFTTAMVDANYSYGGGYDIELSSDVGTAGWFNEISRLAGSLQIRTNNSSAGVADSDLVCINIFR